MNNTNATLVIFCKRPKLNQGKQRLAASIGSERAYQLAMGLLECAIEDAIAWQGPVVLAISEREDLFWAEVLMSRRLAKKENKMVILQPEGNLGQRINQVDQQLRALGHTETMIIGTDSPGLTTKDYLEVQQSLIRNDVVLSHANDGGVVIMANKRAWPDLSFLPWSTEKLGEALEELCVSCGRNVGEIPSNFDVDVEQDLDVLLESIRFDRRNARIRLTQWLDMFFSKNKQDKRALKKASNSNA